MLSVVILFYQVSSIFLLGLPYSLLLIQSHQDTPRFSLVVGNSEWLEEAQYFYIFLEWIRQVKVSKTVVKPFTIYKKQCSIYAFSFEFGSITQYDID